MDPRSLSSLAAVCSSDDSLLMPSIVPRAYPHPRERGGTHRQGRLLARGEDPRLHAEAQSLGEVFTTAWEYTVGPPTIERNTP